jgi:hypothetical protein
LFSFSIRFFKRLRSIQRKLSSYEEYRRDVIHRWGKEEVSRIEAELWIATQQVVYHRRESTILPKYKQSRRNAYLGLLVLRARIANYTLNHRVECRYVGRFVFGVEEVIEVQSIRPAQANRPG